MTKEQALELKIDDWVICNGVSIMVDEMQPLLDGKPRQIKGIEKEVVIRQLVVNGEGKGATEIIESMYLTLKGIKDDWAYGLKYLKRVPTQQELANTNHTYFATDGGGGIFEYRVEPTMTHGIWVSKHSGGHCIDWCNRDIVPLECDWKDSLIKPQTIEHKTISDDVVEAFTHQLACFGILTGNWETKPDDHTNTFRETCEKLVKSRGVCVENNRCDLKICPFYKVCIESEESESDEITFTRAKLWLLKHPKKYVPYTDFDNNWINLNLRKKENGEIHTIVGLSVVGRLLLIRDEYNICEAFGFRGAFDEYENLDDTPFGKEKQNA